MDMDILILYQDLFTDRKITLDGIIDEYQKYITFDRKRKYKDEEHMKEHIKRTLVPFSIFLSNHPISKMLSTPKVLMEKGFKLFD
jgi:hypothetical protein